MKACYFGEENVMMELIFKHQCDLTITNNVISEKLYSYCKARKNFIGFDQDIFWY